MSDLQTRGGGGGGGGGWVVGGGGGGGAGGGYCGVFGRRESMQKVDPSMFFTLFLQM